MEKLALNINRIWLFMAVFLAGFSSTPLQAEPLTARMAFTSNSASAADTVTLSFGCINGEPGDTICLPVTVENFTDIAIAQCEIIWNSEVLDFIKIQNPGLPNINVGSDFNLSGPNALKFIPLGFPISGVSLPDGAVLFEICFRIIGTPGSGSCVGISPYFTYEIANADDLVPVDSVDCCMTVDNAVDLVGFVTSCGPDIAGNDGTIDVTVYGGMEPYDITWIETIGGSVGGPVIVPNEGGNTVINVPAGMYIVTITDASGSMVNYSIEVSALGLIPNTRIKQPTCYKIKNGIIYIKPQGGTAPFSYIWHSLTNSSLAGSGFIRNPGDSSLVTSLPHGIYSIIVKDKNGCQVEVMDTLLENPFVFDVTALQDATCNGSADGLIDLTITGAKPDVNGNYTILVRPGFQVQSNMIAVGLLNPGEHCITVSDQVSQCDTVFCFTIGYTDTITSTVTISDLPCPGMDNGEVILRGRTNGIPGPMYSYYIYKGSTLVTSSLNKAGNYTYSNLGAGNYVAIIEEGSCKSDSIHFTLNEPPPIMVSLVGTNPDNCLPSPTGDAWFSITNGTGPYTLDAGVGFQDADTLFNINSGNYIVTVTDANGCQATLPFHIPAGDENEEQDISFVIDGTPCEGGLLIVLYQGNPVPPGIGVLWSNGMVNDTIEITETDTLSVDLVIGPPLFCILDDTVQINCEEILRLDITVTQPLCGEGALGGPYTGTVIVDTMNAVAPVTWYWSVPDTTTTGIYTGLAPGKYYVTVTDARDSMAIDSFEIIAPPSLHLTFSNITLTSCPGTCDGGVQVTPSDGDPSSDYFLYWDLNNPMADTGATFAISNLCSGFNSFTVSQDGSCFFLDSVDIPAPDSLQIDLVRTVDASCYGMADGELEVSASGGTPNYTYAWTNGPVSPVSTGLAPGFHEVMVTDANNCTTIDSFQVAQPDSLFVIVNISASSDLSCGASNDGLIILETSGGNAGPYTFSWNPNVSTSYQAVNLQAGHYAITVADVKGCTDTTSYTLTSPPPLMADWPVVDQPLCFGDETLLQINSATGGSGNYQISINSGPLFDLGDPIFLPAGIYTISVFDDKGCSDDSIYTIMEPNPILVSVAPNDAVIDLGDSLMIQGTVLQSDNPIMTTLWTSSEPMSCPDCYATYVFNSLPAIYTWTVTDVNGCTASAMLTVDVDYDRDVYIPNVFTPNFDGRNDEFKIYTGPGVTQINSLQIYDRWGNLVHSAGPFQPSPTGAGDWDGTSKGKALNPGVYIYVAEITFQDNETLHYRGDVTLIK